MTGYRPMTLADLAGHLSRAADDRTRWNLILDGLERTPGTAQPVPGGGHVSSGGTP